MPNVFVAYYNILKTILHIITCNYNILQTIIQTFIIVHKRQSIVGIGYVKKKVVFHYSFFSFHFHLLHYSTQIVTPCLNRTRKKRDVKVLWVNYSLIAPILEVLHCIWKKNWLFRHLKGYENQIFQFVAYVFSSGIH